MKAARKARRGRDRRKCAFYDGDGGCRLLPGYTDKCEGTNRCKIYKEKGQA